MTAWSDIDPDGRWLAIGAAQSEYGLCLQIPGMNKKADDIWRVPLSWPAYVAFKAVWSVQPITETPELASWAADRWKGIQQQYEMRMALDAPPELARELIAMENGGELHLDAIQRGHVAWLERWRRVILGDPLGNGKTPPLIRSLQRLRATGEGCPALVICPGSAMRSWMRKLAAWAPELSVSMIEGTARSRRLAIEQPADVYLIAWPNVRYHTRLSHYASQRMVCCPEHGGVDPKITAARCEVHDKEFTGLGLRTIIADECHRMADARSKQTRAVTWLAHHAENFWAVTGTLTADNVASLWPVLHAIDPKAWPAKSRYMDLYAVRQFAYHGGSTYLDLRPDTAAYFHTAVDPMFRRLPLTTGRPGRCEPEFRYPEMTPAQRRMYEPTNKELMAETGGHTLVPDNSAVRFGRLVQLACSEIQLEDGEDRDGFTRQVVKLGPDSNKAADLLEFLGDNEGQWIVWHYSPDLIALCEKKLDAAKIPHTKIIGGMGNERSDAAAQLFQLNPEVRVIFINATGVESIDLQAARGVIFLQPNPSFTGTEQVIGRADRRGQTHPVRIVYMITPETVDSRLYELSQDKDERHQTVTRDSELMRWVLTEGELAGA